MNQFEQQLEEQLEQLRAAGLHRELRRVDSPQGPRVSIGGQSLINFSSNDYLGLAGHIAEMYGWTVAIFNEDGIDFDPKTYKPYQPTSVADLLKTFDDNVARSKQAMAAASEDTLDQDWRFKMSGRVVFERPKAAVFRDVALSHVIHHRGQLSVYLRLLDIPVPGSYGPSADESM